MYSNNNYNAYSPTAYSPYNFYSPYNSYLQNTNTQQQQQNESNVTWIQVNGINGARDVTVQPNQTKWLMDINSQSFFVKSADSLGVSSLKCYRFEEFDPNLNEKGNTDISDTYVKKDEFDSFKSKIEQLEKIIKNNIENNSMPIDKSKKK